MTKHLTRQISALALCLCILLACIPAAQAATLAITRQPVNGAAPLNKTATASVEATGDGLSYRWYFKDAGSTVYSKSSMNTATYSLVMTPERDGRRAFCRITDKYGNVVDSDSVVMSVATPLKITRQPINSGAVLNKTATTSVEATGDGLSYRWYFKDAGSTVYSKSSMNTATYSLVMTPERDGRRAFCRITDKYGNVVDSDSVVMSVATPLKITRQPANAGASYGGVASTSVAATGDGLTYRWYFAFMGDTSFASTSQTTPTFSVKMTENFDCSHVYCVITDKYGNSVTSATAMLSLGKTLKITRQPTDSGAVLNKTATTSVEATGDGLSYRWYFKDTGSSVYSKSSMNTATYSLVMTPERDGRRAFCRITDKYGNVVDSDSVVMKVATPLKITRQPADTATTDGKTLTTSVDVAGDGLTYRWYYKDPGASTYARSAVTTPTYSLAMSSRRNGRQVYCRITDQYGNTVNSNSALLTMAAYPQITRQPANTTVNAGETATVSVAATGDGLTYRWYYMDNGSCVYTKSSVTTPSYSLLMNAARNGRLVYCIVTDKYGNNLYSASARLKVASTVKITRQPAGVTVASGETATVSVGATGEGLTYRWYYRDPGSTAFSVSSATTASYSLLMNAARDGRQVYCRVTDKYGYVVNSAYALLTMATPPKITRQPAGVTVASGETATVSVAAIGDGLTYRWYYKDAGSSTYAKSSVTTSTYSLGMNAARDGRLVYCVITDRYGQQVTSGTATLSMKHNPKLEQFNGTWNAVSMEGGSVGSGELPIEPTSLRLRFTINNGEVAAWMDYSGEITEVTTTATLVGDTLVIGDEIRLVVGNDGRIVWNLDDGETSGRVFFEQAK